MSDDDGFGGVRAALVAAAQGPGQDAWTEGFAAAGIEAPMPPVYRGKRVTEAIRAPASKLVVLCRTILNAGWGARPEQDWVEKLVSALRAAGYLADPAEDDDGVSIFDRMSPRKIRWTVTSDADLEMPVQPQVQLVQSQLVAAGFLVAANHLRQAVDSYWAGNLEAANSQIRSTMEAVLKRLDQHRLKGGVLPPGTGTGSLQALRKADVIDRDEHNLLTGLTSLLHSGGSHAGVTNQAVADMRLRVTLGLIPYMLHRIPLSDGTPPDDINRAGSTE